MSKSTASPNALNQSLPVTGIPERKTIFVICLLAFLLTLPSLQLGLSRDDYFHRAFLSGLPLFPDSSIESSPGASEAANSLFAFFDRGRSDGLENALRWGVAPWWTASDLKISFWRPVAALSHWVDYQLWPDNVRLLHLHNVLWYFALVAVWGIFLYRAGVSGVALFAGFALYAWDASHSEAVSWIANRNILIASFFGFVSLLAFSESLTRKSFSIYALSLVCFLLALLSAEGGVSIAAFIFSYSIFLQQSNLYRRLLSIAPFGVLVVLWRVCYSNLGFGVGGSGVYLDPVADGATFFQNLLIQAPILLMDQFSGLESLTLILSDEVLKKQAYLACFVITITMVTLIPLLRVSRFAMFLLISGLLAVVPAGTTLLTGGRLMFFSGAALAALLGLFVTGIVMNAGWVPRTRWYRVWAWLLVLIVGFGQVAANSYMWYTKIDGQLDRQGESRISDFGNVYKAYNGTATELFVLRAPSAFELMFSQIQASYQQIPHPKILRLLSPLNESLVLARIDERTLEIQFPTKNVMTNTVPKEIPVVSMDYALDRVDRLFFDDFSSLSTSYHSDELTVEIVEIDEKSKAPRAIRYRFVEPLESERYHWITWDDQSKTFVSIHLPLPGEKKVFEKYNKI